jgi:hypothetical protein
MAIKRALLASGGDDAWVHPLSVCMNVMRMMNQMVVLVRSLALGAGSSPSAHSLSLWATLSRLRIQLVTVFFFLIFGMVVRSCCCLGRTEQYHLDPGLVSKRKFFHSLFVTLIFGPLHEVVDVGKKNN